MYFMIKLSSKRYFNQYKSVFLFSFNKRTKRRWHHMLTFKRSLIIQSLRFAGIGTFLNTV